MLLDSGLWIKGVNSDELPKEAKSALIKLEQSVLFAVSVAQKISVAEKRQRINEKLYALLSRTRETQKRVVRIENNKFGFFKPILKETSALVSELDIVIAEIISAVIDFSKYQQAEFRHLRHRKLPIGEYFFGLFLTELIRLYLSHKIYFATIPSFKFGR